MWGSPVSEHLTDDLADQYSDEDCADNAGGSYLQSIGVFNIKDMSQDQWREYFRIARFGHLVGTFERETKLKYPGWETHEDKNFLEGTDRRRMQERAEDVADETGAQYLSSINEYDIRKMTRDQWRIYYRNCCAAYDATLDSLFFNEAPF